MIDTMLSNEVCLDLIREGAVEYEVPGIAEIKEDYGKVKQI